MTLVPILVLDVSEIVIFLRGKVYIFLSLANTKWALGPQIDQMVKINHLPETFNIISGYKPLLEDLSDSSLYVLIHVDESEIESKIEFWQRDSLHLVWYDCMHRMYRKYVHARIVTEIRS